MRRHPVQLMRFIESLEENLGSTVQRNLLPTQPGRMFQIPGPIFARYSRKSATRQEHRLNTVWPASSHGSANIVRSTEQDQNGLAVTR